MKKTPLIFLSALTLAVTAAMPAHAAWNQRTFNSVLHQLNRYWSSSFTASNRSFRSPKVYAHTRPGRSRCAPVRAAHYCQHDHTVHLNMRFLSHLAQDIGDSAAYWVVAHEFGHSVQSQLASSAITRSTPQLELQADCLAGMFFAAADRAGQLEEGDFKEATIAAIRTGDYNFGHHDHHGTPIQRGAAFSRGFHSQNCSNPFR